MQIENFENKNTDAIYWERENQITKKKDEKHFACVERHFTEKRRTETSLKYSSFGPV
jgi:hypothetical protein